jgi:hypothetical protein
MAEHSTDDLHLYQAYLDEIRRRVCGLCLDRRDDGTCHLKGGRTCAIDAQLPSLVESIRDVQRGRMDEYVEAIEAGVCSQCEGRASTGQCAFRDRGECALWMYLALVVDAVETVALVSGVEQPIRDQ